MLKQTGARQVTGQFFIVKCGVASKGREADAAPDEEDPRRQLAKAAAAARQRRASPARPRRWETRRGGGAWGSCRSV